MQRRHFLSLGSGALALTACSANDPSNITSVVSSVATDISTIAGGLLGVLPSLGGISGLSAAAVATVGAAIADLQVLAGQIKTVNTTEAAQPIVQQVEANVNTIVSAMAGLPVIPPPFSIALQAASILLPIIETAINLMVPPKVAAQAAKGRLTPDQARHVLLDLAPKR